MHILRGSSDYDGNDNISRSIVYDDTFIDSLSCITMGKQPPKLYYNRDACLLQQSTHIYITMQSSACRSVYDLQFITVIIVGGKLDLMSMFLVGSSGTLRLVF